jgi:putative mRNA 3-end processing factor
MLGSAQIRIERGGEVWVCSGDYKLDPDPTCMPFEPVPCHAFITESTFALPIFRWPSPADVFSELHAWWRANQESGRASVVFAYPLGKAQRVLAGLDPATGPIVCHPSIDAANAIYRAQGVALPPTVADTKERARALVLAPPLTAGSTWLRRFPRVSLSMASGWMRIRGPRRRRALDRGFVLSDHADWPSLQTAIAATRAERVWVTHGYRESLARWLNENGTPAQAIELPTPPEPEA